MKKFYLEEIDPSDLTIRIIKQIAHSYCISKLSNKKEISYLN
jgi:hypothetical protein